jgi:hypothetical protein
MSQAAEARRAFDQGDYAQARKLAQATLGQKDASSADSETARLVLERTAPPKNAKYMFLLAAVLLVLLSVFWLGQSKKHAAEEGVRPGLPSAAPSTPQLQDRAP